MVTPKYTIKENSLLARIAAFKLGSHKMAMVIGRTIHLYNTSKEEFLENKTWFRHELKHVEQYARHGTLPFLFLYLWESIKKGYHHNKYEVEAREAENNTDTIC
jgi:hypothetical protein